MGWERIVLAILLLILGFVFMELNFVGNIVFFVIGIIFWIIAFYLLLNQKAEVKKETKKGKKK